MKTVFAIALTLFFLWKIGGSFLDARTLSTSGVQTLAVIDNAPCDNHRFLHYRFSVAGVTYHGVGPGLVNGCGDRFKGTTIPIGYLPSNPDINSSVPPATTMRDSEIALLFVGGLMALGLLLSRQHRRASSL